LDDPDANVRSAFRSAIDQIEQAKPEPDAEKEAKKRSLILKDIDELKQARKGQSEKGKPAGPTKE
jgi:hypothetical protein